MNPTREAPARDDARTHTVEVLAGWRRRSTQARMIARLLRLAARAYRDPVRAARAVRAALAFVRDTAPESDHMVRVRGRAYGRLVGPGFPSPAFDREAEVELNRRDAFRSGCDVPMALLAITHRCALRCEHCSEWDTLNRPDALSVDDLRAIVAMLQARGAARVELTGGEPLLRLDAVEALVRGAAPGTDFWVLTSGAQLTEDAARRLADAGVTGVAVSLDHWDPARHDAFRGARGTFERAVRGMAFARDAGLVVAADVTATRATANHPDLLRITAVARDHGASFLRLIEPQAAGRWASADIALGREHLDALRGLARAANARWPREAPIVDDVGGTQRRFGCFGAGQHYLFIDAAGDVHACPFCRAAAGNCLREGLDAIVARLRARGCEGFPDARLVALRRRAGGGGTP